MIEFLLNNKLENSSLPGTMVLLDFLRERKKLKGTKSACREGDCGSCTVIVGGLVNGHIEYKAMASCLTPLANVNGKHVVAIEGLDMPNISPIQQALVDAAAIQCGYCTPGIVLSLTAYFLSAPNYSMEGAVNAIAGNICRCTGYKSIERAIGLIFRRFEKNGLGQNLEWLIKNNFVPKYFSEVAACLSNIPIYQYTNNKQIIGGGTDLYVQQADKLIGNEARYVSNEPELSAISCIDNKCIIGGACKVSDLEENKVLKETIPRFENFMDLIASQLIRNMATVAGNFVNASPIGDLSILFLALDAKLELELASKTRRTVKLNQFFKDYKKIDLQEGELIKSIQFELPTGSKFNFEKVSKRKYLDIATVNTALQIQVENNKVSIMHLSMGGVAAIPLYLEKTCDILVGKELSEAVIKDAAKVLNDEISPISDVRGSAKYKRLLARQLFFAHFVELFDFSDLC